MIKCKNKDAPSEVKIAIRKILQEHFICRFLPQGWIAGGAIRSRIANDGKSDWDCYFTSESDLQASLALILSSNITAAIKINDEHLVSISSTIGKIDLVRKFYTNPVDTLLDFDFTVCCFAMDNDNWFYYLPQAITDLKAKKLVLYNPRDGLSSMMRLQKYATKGYTMEFVEHQKLADLIKNKPFDETVKRMAGRPGY